MRMYIKKMDNNGDGMISKKEFMKYHEAMWAKVQVIARDEFLARAGSEKRLHCVSR
jgi:hypothetical protein